MALGTECKSVKLNNKEIIKSSFNGLKTQLKEITMRKAVTFIYSAILISLLSITSVLAEDVNSRKNFAVIWTIDTNDAGLFNDTIADHSKKVLELWKDGVIENVYIDSEKTHDVVHKGDVARVMFFIKAKTDKEAKMLLDDMPLVTNKVATYSLYPAGTLWLKQF